MSKITSATATNIQNFLNKEFQKELKGYFEDSEKAESTIVDCPSLSIEVEKESSGYSKRYSVEIIIPTISDHSSDEIKKLPGQLLRNRSRIESNLAVAIRKLIPHHEPHWNPSVIGKVTVTIE